MLQMLILAANPQHRATLAARLTSDAIRVRQVATLEAAQQALQHAPCDILIAALGPTLPEFHTGLLLATEVKQHMAMSTTILLVSHPMLEAIVHSLPPDLWDHILTGPTAYTQVLSLVQRLISRHTLRHAKIVCTIGPASDSEAVLAQLIEAGMNVARLNFSHGEEGWHRTVCERIRRLSDQVAVMADLQGPKLRIGSMQDEQVVTLEQGATFILTSRPVAGTAEIVSLDYPALPQEVEVGDTLYLNDGLIELQVCAVRDGSDIVCRVVTGGPLSSRKGLHAPRASLSLRIPTMKDHQDIRTAVELGVDFLAVSFVTTADDLQQVRAVMQQAGGDIPLISKIERAMALERFPSILEASDGVMVARGDLAVNIPPEDVPRSQKVMIRHCNQQGKPVICATQMLESMQSHPLPTRAEVSDVFNAILDGADAVMLSGESAVGAYPVEAVRMMVRIVRQAEAMLPPIDLAPSTEIASPSEIIGHGIATMLERAHRHRQRITAVLAITREGHSARMIAKYRPGVPIIAATSSHQVARQLLLSRGITPMLLTEELTDPAAMIHTAILQGLEQQHLCAEDTVLTISGAGWAPQSPTNIMGVFAVRDVLEGKTFAS
jgi:pyruvate kinase